MIKILLADDQSNVRRGLRMRLDLEPGVDIVGEAHDGASAIALARALSPDVILMDVEMPGMDGITATETLHREAPNCCVVLLTIHDDARTRARAASAGCAAFISKTRIDTNLMDAIRQASTHAATPPGLPDPPPATTA